MRRVRRVRRESLKKLCGKTDAKFTESTSFNRNYLKNSGDGFIN